MNAYNKATSNSNTAQNDNNSNATLLYNYGLEQDIIKELLSYQILKVLQQFNTKYDAQYEDTYKIDCTNNGLNVFNQKCIESLKKV